VCGFTTDPVRQLGGLNLIDHVSDLEVKATWFSKA